MTKKFQVIASSTAIVLAGLIFAYQNFTSVAVVPYPDTSASYAGLYAVINPRAASSDLVDIQNQAMANSDLHGVVILDYWDKLAPTNGNPSNYKWTSLDNWIQLALQNNKYISIGVIAGNFTPTWLSNEGVPFVDYKMDANRGRTYPIVNCKPLHLPVPWSPRFQNQYGNMMQNLSVHLKTTVYKTKAGTNFPLGAAYNAVKIVKVGAINQVTGELGLGRTTLADESCPNLTLADGSVVSQTADKAWSLVHFGPMRLASAWSKIAAKVNAAFPDKVLSISVLQKKNAFPLQLIDGSTYQSKEQSIDDATLEIITAGLNSDPTIGYPGRFSVQWNALNTGEQLGESLNPGIMTFVGNLAVTSGSIVGWQTNAGGGADGVAKAQCGTVSSIQACTAAEYGLILQNGVNNHATFLELWPADVVRFSNEVNSAATLF